MQALVPGRVPLLTDRPSSCCRPDQRERQMSPVARFMIARSLSCRLPPMGAVWPHLAEHRRAEVPPSREPLVTGFRIQRSEPGADMREPISTPKFWPILGVDDYITLVLHRGSLGTRPLRRPLQQPTAGQTRSIRRLNCHPGRGLGTRDANRWSFRFQGRADAATATSFINVSQLCDSSRKVLTVSSCSTGIRATEGRCW